MINEIIIISSQIIFGEYDNMINEILMIFGFHTQISNINLQSSEYSDRNWVGGEDNRHYDQCDNYCDQYDNDYQKNDNYHQKNDNLEDLQSGEYWDRDGVGGEEGDETKHSVHTALNLHNNQDNKQL